MKNKAPLSMMEQLIMILVFALAAALCLQGFSLADEISHRQETRQNAVVFAQNTAECIKSNHGNWSATASQLDGQWDGKYLTISDPSAGQLQASSLETDFPLLGVAKIQVFDLQGQDLLFELTISWQEVTDHEIP